MEPVEELARAQREFGRRVAAVPPGAWGNPTPCEEWDVTTLVRHVVGGDRMACVILAGGSRDEGKAAFRGVDLGDDPAAVFEDTAARLREAVASAGDLDRVVVAHPMTDMPARQLLAFRMCDLVVHAWDLARGAGLDDRLDREVVSAVWADIAPTAPALPHTGMFGSGASGTLGDDADPQDRLLDALGRRP